MTKSKEQMVKEQFKDHLKKSGFADPEKAYNEMMNNGDHLTSTDRNGWPLSHVVCFYGLEDIVPQIIQKGLVNTLDKNGSPPLYWACRRHRYEVIEMLVNSGADVDIQSKDKIKPLFGLLAINNAEKDFASMKLILDKSANPIALAKEALMGSGIDNVNPNKPTAERNFLNEYIRSKVTDVPGSFTHAVSSENKEQTLQK